MKYNLDELLKRALTPKEEPGEALNRKILDQVKEEGSMKNRRFMRKGAVAAVAAALAAAGSMTAFAAWQYRSASQVAEELGEEDLPQAFEEQAAADNADSNDKAVYESQSFGGYKVVLLGMVSGKDLSAHERMAGGTIHSDRTYLAVAVSREDGRPVDAEAEDFFVSPLIGSLNPKDNNVLVWAGNYGQYVEDGILYRLTECDNIEYFADQNLYVCVTDTTFYQKGLYDWREEEGEIVRNDGYEGLNALFELQIDPSKADPEKAGNLLQEMNKQGKDTQEASRSIEEDPYDRLSPESRKAYQEAVEWAEQITPDNIEQYCVRLEQTVQTKAPDGEGRVSFDESLSGADTEDTSFKVDWFFRGGEITDFIQRDVGTGGMEEVLLKRYTLNEDGTVTFAIWVPREGSKWLK